MKSGVLSVSDLPPHVLRTLGISTEALKLESQPPVQETSEPPPSSKGGDQDPITSSEPQPVEDEKTLTPWIQFSCRVEKQVRAMESKLGTGKGEKVRVGDVKKFASALKAKKAYDEWSDQDILLEFLAWQKDTTAKATQSTTTATPDEKPSVTSSTSEEPKKKGGRPKKQEETPSGLEESKPSSEVSEESKKKGGRTKKVEELPAAIASVSETPTDSTQVPSEEPKKRAGRTKKEGSAATSQDPPIPPLPTAVSMKMDPPSTLPPLPPSPPNEEKDPLHIRRKAIPKHIKTLVWNKYIGSDKAEAKCVSCRQERIDNRNFHCGHVIAESKGGDMTINNLRPICAPCNLSMGSRSMNEFTSEFFGWTV